MLNVNRALLALVVLALASACGPGDTVPNEEVLKAFPVSGMDDVITRSGVTFDALLTSDGNGSLRIAADQPVTIPLYEVEDPDAEAARLTYRARLRSENLRGKAFLEMWCRFAGKGEFFSRGLQSAVSGTTEWTSQETPFFLKAGEKPDLVKLNLVIDGKGTVWIDEISLLKGPLPPAGG